MRCYFRDSVFRCSPTTRWSSSRKRGPILPERDARVILVAVDLNPQSAHALKSAHDLSWAIGLPLRVLHVVPEELFAEANQLAPGISESVQRWAALEAGVQLQATDIRVACGKPAAIILAESHRPDVDMVVIGSAQSAARQARDTTLQALLRACPQPLLCAGPRGPQPVVVAATDCSDPALPVFQRAWLMATALGDRLAVVHNVDRVATQFAQRIGAPMSTLLASRLAARSRVWLQESAGAGEVIITRHPDDALGVLSAAHVLQAELIVVGVKPDECAPRKTAERIFEGRCSSVLFVPLLSKERKSIHRVY